MSSTKPREHREICTRSNETRNTREYRQYPQYVQNLETPRLLAVHTPRSTYSRNTARTLSTRVVSSESNVLQLPLVGPSVRFVPNNGPENCRHVRRRSKSTSYSKYTGHIESISVLGVLVVRTLPTNEILIVLAVPAVQNPKILEAQQGVSTVAAVENPELVRARNYPQRSIGSST